MRGKTLAELLQQLKAEIGDDLTSSSEDGRYQVLLSTAQQELATAWDWSFLRVKAGDADVAVPAGSRYLTMPLLNLDREVKAECFFNNYWQCVEHGIGSDEYNLYDSDQSEVQDPIQRWQEISETVDVDGVDHQMFEVWPMTAIAGTVRFWGQRALLALEDDADKADIDDTLLVLTVAVPILVKRESANATIAAKRLDERLKMLRATGPVRDQKLVLGQKQHYRRPSVRKIIIVG